MTLRGFNEPALLTMIYPASAGSSTQLLRHRIQANVWIALFTFSGRSPPLMMIRCDWRARTAPIPVNCLARSSLSICIGVKKMSLNCYYCQDLYCGAY